MQKSLLAMSCRLPHSLPFRSGGKKSCCYLPFDKIKSYSILFVLTLKWFFSPKCPIVDLPTLCVLKSALSLGWDFFPFLPARAVAVIPALPMVFLPLKSYWSWSDSTPREPFHLWTVLKGLNEALLDSWSIQGSSPGAVKRAEGQSSSGRKSRLWPTALQKQNPTIFLYKHTQISTFELHGSTESENHRMVVVIREPWKII